MDDDEIDPVLIAVLGQLWRAHRESFESRGLAARCAAARGR